MPPTLYGPPPPKSPEPQGVLYGPVPDLYETSKKRKWHYLIIVISIIIGFLIGGVIAWLLGNHFSEEEPTVYGPPPIDNIE